MTRDQFLQRRRPQWKKLERRLDAVGGLSLRRATVEEIREVSQLMREVASDLALIRARDWGAGLTQYLNGMLSKANNVFYRSPPSRLRDVAHFLLSGFPQMVRANWAYFALAAALFFVPLAATWTTIQVNPSLASRVLPSEQLDQMNEMYSDEEPSVESPAPVQVEEPATSPETEPEVPTSQDQAFGEQRAAMAGFYVQHNVGIALQCFARGLLLGIGTVITLLFNGISIGAVAGYVLSQGHHERFLSFVISHGSFELTAIAVAGGAGLILGDALIHPGNRTRRDALRVRAVDAVQLAGGAAAMLVIAAMIEAFWSPAAIPAMTKYVVGTFLWLVVMAYLCLAGGRRET